MARPLNSANKNKAYLLKRLQDMYGADFNPVIKVAENAVALQLAADKEPDKTEVRVAAVNAWDKVAQYVEPKLKAMEISTLDADGKSTGFKVTFTNDKKDSDTSEV
tara:strand:+ start:416 stop:733 length:318 start_codon:yes stop_codon:yes gene_type:complete